MQYVSSSINLIMKVISLDISGKVFKYDNALYDAVIKESCNGDELLCLTPYRAVSTLSSSCYSLYCLVPQEKANSSGLPKRISKAVEGVLNYIRLGRIVRNFHPNILHLQWLPFLECCGIEYYFLKWFKRINKNLKLVLTVHNIYPHNFNDKQKEAYQKRFIKVSALVDSFILHTKVSCCELNTEFGVSLDNINVIKHGVFVPESVPKRSRKVDGKCRLLMFGYQSYYKGTDLLIEAVKKLPVDLQAKIIVKIVGRVSEGLLPKVNENHENIFWKNAFLSDDELNEEIVNADVLVYPYRKISQSGALLLGLSFRKPIIASNLPSFVETLAKYPPEMFFEAGNANSLKETIEKYLSFDNVFKWQLVDILSEIKEDNSWEASAKETLDFYRELSDVFCR